MTRRFIVKGVVQGVGFRWFVSRLAEQHGLRGCVWNRADGAVEAVVQHVDESRIAVFEQALWTGPGSVLSVEGHEVGDPKSYDGFRIVSQNSSDA